MSNNITMIDASTRGEVLSQIIGRIEGVKDGPTIVVLAGIHGNEPAGIKTLTKLFKDLESTESKFRGKLIGVCANLRAIEEGVRYVDEDMNRIWFKSIIDRIQDSDVGEIRSSERREIKKLLELMEQEIPDKPGSPIIFVDLHSFSAQGDMFAITARKENHIEILSSMNVPMIFGIDEALPGTALRYFQDLGYVTFALEGGNHENKLTVFNNTAALILLLVTAGCLDSQNIPHYNEYKRHLVQQNKQLPSMAELVYQHIIEDGDHFEMKPGYTNFQPVKEGEWLASDKNGQIRAQCDGYILMPLYQKQGNDGFFIVRKQG